MKLLVTFIFAAILASAVEQGNPKKTPFETDRNSEALLQQKVNYENKTKVDAKRTISTADTKSVKTEAKPTSPSGAAENNSKAPEGAPAESAAPDAQVLVCKSGSEVRNVEIHKKGSGCEVIYTKKGEPKVIAQQKLGNLRCDHVFQDLQSKLAKGGFTCESK